MSFAYEETKTAEREGGRETGCYRLHVFRQHPLANETVFPVSHVTYGPFLLLLGIRTVTVNPHAAVNLDLCPERNLPNVRGLFRWD